MDIKTGECGHDVKWAPIIWREKFFFVLKCRNTGKVACIWIKVLKISYFFVTWCPHLKSVILQDKQYLVTRHPQLKNILCPPCRFFVTWCPQLNDAVMRTNQVLLHDVHTWSLDIKRTNTIFYLMSTFAFRDDDLFPFYDTVLRLSKTTKAFSL